MFQAGLLHLCIFVWAVLLQLCFFILQLLLHLCFFVSTGSVAPFLFVCLAVLLHFFCLFGSFAPFLLLCFKQGCYTTCVSLFVQCYHICVSLFCGVAPFVFLCFAVLLHLCKLTTKSKLFQLLMADCSSSPLASTNIAQISQRQAQILLKYPKYPNIQCRAQILHKYPSAEHKYCTNIQVPSTNIAQISQAVPNTNIAEISVNAFFPGYDPHHNRAKKKT